MIENEFLNRVELRGRVGHDPKVFSVGDAQVARFSLATNEAFRGKSGELREETTWHNISAWAGRNIMDFKEIRKGAFVSLVGRLRNIKYTGNDGTLHQIWMEDTESLGQKIDSMRASGIAGIAEWSLGMETSDVWDVIANYVNG